MAGFGGDAGMAGVGGEAGMIDIPGQVVDYAFSQDNLLVVLREDGRFSTYVDIVETAELSNNLSDSRMIATHFVPTDGAFEVFSDENPGIIVGLTASPEAALAFIQRHMTIGTQDADRLAQKEYVNVVSGHRVSVARNDDGLTVSNAQVLAPMLPASNGAIHPLNAVLEAPDRVAAGTCAQPSAGVVGEQIGSSTGRESVVYRLIFEADDTYCIDTLGSAFNTVLKVFENCQEDEPVVLAENDDVTTPFEFEGVTRERSIMGFMESRVELNSSEGQQVDIEISGARSVNGIAAGDFVLNVRQGPCSPITVTDYLNRRGEFTILLDLLTRFELADELNEAGFGSLLAPNDQAFLQQEIDDPGVLANLALDGNELVAFLRHHQLAEVRLASELVGIGRVVTRSGAFVDVQERAAEIFVNGVLVRSSNNVVDNGLVHELEGVLNLPEGCAGNGDCDEGLECNEGQCLPPAPPGNVLEELRVSGQHNRFVNLIENAELELLFETEAPITVFAPIDDGIPAMVVEMLGGDDALRYDTLIYHVAPELFLEDDLNVANSVETYLMGRSVEVRRGIDGVLIDGVPVIDSDLVALNGVIHRVASVLQPPEEVDACVMPRVIDGDARENGSTIGAGSRHEASCGVGADGPEVAYLFSPIDDVRVCFDTLSTAVPADGRGFDSVIHIRQGDCGNELAEVACNDDCNGVNCLHGGEDAYLSELTFEAQGGQDYYVFVDGVNGNAGDFVLTASDGGCGEPDPVGNLLALARADESLSTFVDAVVSAGLEDLLEELTSQTVFVPTNDAFAALGDNALDELMRDPERLRSIIRHHIVAGRVHSGRLSGQQQFFSLNDTPIMTNTVQGEIRVAGAGILQPDLQATNGIMHVLDGVALPPVRCERNDDCGGDEVCELTGFCGPAPILGTCAAPFVIDSFATYQGDTSDGISNEFGSCIGPGAATDHVYRLDTVGQFEVFDHLDFEVCLSTLGSEFDTAIYIREGNCDGRELTCVDDVDLGGFVFEEAAATLQLEAGQTYTIIVDGFGAATGNYQLDVLNGPCQQ